MITCLKYPEGGEKVWKHNNPKRLLAACGIWLLMMIFAVGCSAVSANSTKQNIAQSANQSSKQEAGKNECAGCHEMKPEFFTWQVSSHSKIACITCHDRKSTDYQVKHDSQSFSKPIRIVNAVPNQVCEQCHSRNRVTSPSGDLKIPHEKHLKAGVTCVTCHNGVVHAKISERGLTSKGELSNYETWNLETAKKVATKFYIQPSMWTCIRCHKQLNINRKCGTCHTTIPTLPSHDKPTWKAEHGKTARTMIKECTKCHATPDIPVFVTPSTGDKAADFARAQEFCYKCHLQRPEMHEKNMLPVHPDKLKERSLQNCLTCHNKEQPTPTDKVTKVYCFQCHWSKNGQELIIQETPSKGVKGKNKRN